MVCHAVRSYCASGYQMGSIAFARLKKIKKRKSIGFGLLTLDDFDGKFIIMKPSHHTVGVVVDVLSIGFILPTTTSFVFPVPFVFDKCFIKHNFMWER